MEKNTIWPQKVVNILSTSPLREDCSVQSSYEWLHSCWSPKCDSLTWEVAVSGPNSFRHYHIATTRRQCLRSPVKLSGLPAWVRCRNVGGVGDWLEWMLSIIPNELVARLVLTTKDWCGKERIRVYSIESLYIFIYIYIYIHICIFFISTGSPGSSISPYVWGLPKVRVDRNSPLPLKAGANQDFGPNGAMNWRAWDNFPMKIRSLIWKWT